jgi:hypothetical protein
MATLAGCENTLAIAAISVASWLWIFIFVAPMIFDFGYKHTNKNVISQYYDDKIFKKTTKVNLCPSN